jgi:hypothetical protein
MKKFFDNSLNINRKLIIMILVLIYQSISIKLKSCLVDTQVQEVISTKTKISPKMLRNVKNFKCISGEEEGLNLQMDFCSPGLKSQTWNFYGFENRNDTYALQNSELTHTVLDSPCESDQETYIRLAPPDYKKDQMFKLIPVEKSTNTKLNQIVAVLSGLCLSSGIKDDSIGEDWLLQVKCDASDPLQQWELLEPITKFKGNWISFLPLPWKEFYLSFRNSDKSFRKSYIRSGEDQYKLGNSWLLTPIPASHSYYLSIGAGNFLYSNSKTTPIITTPGEESYWKWDIIMIKEDEVALRSVAYGTCLTFDGTERVKLSECEYGDDQKLKFKVADKIPINSIYSFVDTSSGKCVENMAVDYEYVFNKECDNENGLQAWKISKKSDGSFTIKSYLGSVYLQSDKDDKEGIKILASSKSASKDDQSRWYIIPNGKEKYDLVNKSTGKKAFLNQNDAYQFNEENGSSFNLKKFVYIRPRKTPFYSIYSRNFTLTYDRTNLQSYFTSKKLEGKGNMSAFKLLMNKDGSFFIKFINGMHLTSTSSCDKISITWNPIDNDKWTILPFSKDYIFYHNKCKRFLKIAETKISLEGSNRLLIKSNGLTVNYIVNNVLDIPTENFVLSIIHKKSGNSFTYKVSPEGGFIDSTSNFETSFKIVKGSNDISNSLVSNSGIKFWLIRNSKWETNFIFHPVGGREYVLSPTSSPLSFINFGLKELTSVKSDYKSLAKINNEQDHTFIFIESNESARLLKGIYTITNSQSNPLTYLTKDTKSLKYSMSIPFNLLGIPVNNPLAYFEIETDTEKQDNRVYIKNIDRTIMIPSPDSKDTQPINSQEYNKNWAMLKYQKDKYIICKTENTCLSNVKNTLSETIYNPASINNFVFDIKMTDINRLDTCNYVSIKSSSADVCLKFREYDQDYLTFSKCQQNDQSFAWKFTEVIEEKKRFFQIENILGHFVSIRNDWDKLSLSHKEFTKGWHKFNIDVVSINNKNIVLSLKDFDKGHTIKGYENLMLVPMPDVKPFPAESDTIRIVSRHDSRCLLDNSSVKQGLSEKTVSFQDVDKTKIDECDFQFKRVPNESSFFVVSVNGDGLYLRNNGENRVSASFLDQNVENQFRFKWHILPIQSNLYQIIHASSKLCLRNENNTLGSCDLNDLKNSYMFELISSTSFADQGTDSTCS